jgi:hypothetical protein
MTFNELQEANKLIKTIDVKGKDYAEVPQRIKAFRSLFPNGAIETSIISNDNQMVVMKATVRDEEGHVLGEGHAYEKESSSFINKTSYIENCETSAVGRALGMCGFGIDTSVASYEEVANAINNQDRMKAEKAMETTPKTEEEARKKCSEAQANFVEKLVAEKHIDKEAYLKQLKIKSFADLTSAQASAIINKLKG